MDLPAEIRVKIYEAYFDKIKVKYTVETQAAQSPKWKSACHVIQRKSEDYNSLALVSQTIRQEILPIATTSPILLEVEGCREQISLDRILSDPVRLRVCAVITDESLDEITSIHRAVMACYLSENRPHFPNLRSVEFQGRPMRVPVSPEVAKVLSGLYQAPVFYRYNLQPEFQARVLTLWSAFGTQTELLINSSQFSLTLRCEFVAWQKCARHLGESIETSIQGVTLPCLLNENLLTDMNLGPVMG